MRRVLVIAGSDSSGGAGIVRDVRTLTQLGVQARCALTAVTAQTDAEVRAVQILPASLVRSQIEAALAAADVGAIKIGMLGSAANIQCVCDCLAELHIPLVVDPVLVASSGGALLEPAGHEVLRRRLVPLTTLLTPNIPEAAALLGVPVARDIHEILAQGEALLELGAAAVLLKGGHAEGPESTDLLFTNTTSVEYLGAARIPNTRRGSGCALATAIAAGLAAELDLREACVRAKHFISEFFQHGK